MEKINQKGEGYDECTQQYHPTERWKDRQVRRIAIGTLGAIAATMIGLGIRDYLSNKESNQDAALNFRDATSYVERDR